MGLKSKSWSPYICGILIGLLQIPAFIWVKSGLGTSTTYAKISGTIIEYFDASIVEGTYFSPYLAGGKYNWQLFLVVGIFLGALLSSFASKTRRKGVSEIWKNYRFMDSTMSRYGMAFLGGVVLLFGARLAGGCTSGHGLTGVGQLAVGSIVTMVMMFIFGILTVRCLRK